MNTVQQFVEIGARFADHRPAAARTWSHVERHAARVWQDTASRDDAFVDLLLAVGNFKRQAPIHLPGARSTTGVSNRSEQLDFSYHESPVRLDATEARHSCKSLESIGGISTATATTVLTALWPSSFAVMDRRTTPVVAALLELKGLDFPRRPMGTAPSIVSADDFADWYLPALRHLAEEAQAPLGTLERGCFLVGPPDPLDPSETWQSYADRLLERLVRWG